MKTSSILIFTLILSLILGACQPSARLPEMEGVVADSEVAGQTLPLATPGSDGSSGSRSPLAYSPVGQRLVIKNAELELLVEDTDQAVSRVTSLAADYGGYIIQAETWFETDFKYASLRLGIPAEAFEAALSQLRDLGLEVLQETASGEDVSAEYVDLQSRLTNLEATADRVRGFLEAAQSVDEALQVNQRLSELEGQIEQVRGQMRFYEGRAAFSTVTVRLTPQRPLAAPVLAPPAWNPAVTLQEALQVLARWAQSAIDAVIWVGVLFGPLAALLGGLFWLARRRMNRWAARTETETWEAK